MTDITIHIDPRYPCRCTKDCEFPCWQRYGIAPPCEACGCNGKDDVPEDTEKSFSETVEEITEMIYDGWLKEDIPVIESMYDNALIVLPLYRSAIVITPGKNPREYILNLHHDPAWLGEEPTGEAFARHCGQFEVYGQRSGIDFVYTPAPCGDGGTAWMTGPVGHYIACPHTDEEVEAMFARDPDYPNLLRGTEALCPKCVGRRVQACFCNVETAHD